MFVPRLIMVGDVEDRDFGTCPQLSVSGFCRQCLGWLKRDILRNPATRIDGFKGTSLMQKGNTSAA